MSENLRLTIAIRRNTLNRSGATFLGDITVAIGRSLQECRLLDADASFRLERQHCADMDTGMKDGSVLRLDPIAAEDTYRIWREFLEIPWKGEYLMFLSNFRDFTLSGSRSMFDDIDILKLVDFDGDTVCVTDTTLSDGICVDKYEEGGNFFYEVDLWGACSVLAQDTEVR